MFSHHMGQIFIRLCSFRCFQHRLATFNFWVLPDRILTSSWHCVLKYTQTLIQGTHFWSIVDASGQPQPCPQVVKSKPRNSFSSCPNCKPQNFLHLLWTLIISLPWFVLWFKTRFCRVRPAAFFCIAKHLQVFHYTIITTMINVNQLHKRYENGQRCIR